MRCVVTLGYREAVDAIKDATIVMYKHGIWNKYEPLPAEKVSKAIIASGYGADVYIDENGCYYVRIPSISDMF